MSLLIQYFLLLLLASCLDKNRNVADNNKLSTQGFNEFLEDDRDNEEGENIEINSDNNNLSLSEKFITHGEFSNIDSSEYNNVNPIDASLLPTPNKIPTPPHHPFIQRVSGNPCYFDSVIHALFWCGILNSESLKKAQDLESNVDSKKVLDLAIPIIKSMEERRGPSKEAFYEFFKLFIRNYTNHKFGKFGDAFWDVLFPIQDSIKGLATEFDLLIANHSCSCTNDINLTIGICEGCKSGDSFLSSIKKEIKKNRIVSLAHGSQKSFFNYERIELKHENGYMVPYKLRAFIKYSRNVTDELNHYYCIAKDANNKWIIYNDIRSGPQETNLGKKINHAILFYELDADWVASIVEG